VLGAPADIDQLQRQIVTLEHQLADLRTQLEERDQDSPPLAPPAGNCSPT
jgi:hypothetical protein